jgi:hypothetical protein
MFIIYFLYIINIVKVSFIELLYFELLIVLYKNYKIKSSIFIII